ncbi:MAG: UDP-N-acetylmuramate dehydrogenase [Saprospiraceae bacterium]
MSNHFQANFSLKNYNTFGIDVAAKSFIEVNSVFELQELLVANRQPIMILGGGSNMLLTKDLEVLVVKNNILGRVVTEENESGVEVAIGGGENWHEIVLWTIENNWGGIENLSLIPGTVGASPIQNIGAYGVELKDVFVKLEAVEIATGDLHTFTKEECEFGYRDSIFKRKLKGKFCITQVYFNFKKAPHQLSTGYGAIQTELANNEIKNPTIQDVSNAVIAIRSSKLPDPKVLGNSGSFFKNPEIERTEFERLQREFPKVVFYELANGKVKVPAGWLIEQAGWKGKRVGNTGAHAKQALVLVNYGGATGSEVWQLAMDIQQSVKDKFGIEITPEVNVL